MVTHLGTVGCYNFLFGSLLQNRVAHYWRVVD